MLLRLAETPRLYLPKRGEDLLDEVRRTQVSKLGFPENLADSWREAVDLHFPEAMVTKYKPLEKACENDEKDRHVLAVAIRCGAEMIVPLNLKHFQPEFLDPWDIKVKHPSDFLTTLYSMESGVVVSKLDSIAADRNTTPQKYLSQLGKIVPAFSKYLADDLNWDLE